MHTGEKPEDTARREAEEETGFTYLKSLNFLSNYINRFPIEEKYRNYYQDSEEYIEEYCFFAEVEEIAEPKIDPTEHIESAWVTFKEAMSMLKWQANKEALAEVYKNLGFS